jgi:long-chain fatty acid transport protein
LKCSIFALSLFGLASLSSAAHASGFLIYEMSAEGMGRAAAVSADSTEPAAVWFNPAGLAYLEGFNASAGGVFVTNRSRFLADADRSETRSERGYYVLPALFAHAALTEHVSVGMGAYSAFGIGIEWPDDWVGRENSTAASLQTLALNPTLALKLHRKFAIAAGFQAIRSAVDFSNGLPAPIGGKVRLGGGGWGFGGNAGLLYRALPDELHLAVTYRSRVKLDFDGEADFDPGSPDFARTLPDQPGDASITLPDIVTFGVMGRPHPALALTFDANVVLWSTYDRVDIDFESAPDRSLEPQGRNTVTLRAGVDYRTPPGLHVRGGLVYDRSAIPEEGLGPGLPDSDRIDVSFGLGYGGRHFDADLGYMIVCFLPADASSGHESPEGTYRTLAHLLGLTLGTSWP